MYKIFQGRGNITCKRTLKMVGGKLADRVTSRAGKMFSHMKIE